MKYAYIVRKQKGKVHELDSSGRTYCQTENSTTRLTFVESFPAGRAACRACAGVKKEREFEATHAKLNAEFRAIATDFEEVPTQELPW